MADSPIIADVLYQDAKAGVVYWDAARRRAVFQYTPEFIERGFELAPLKMPLRKAPYQFLNLHESFSGMPGMLADCLPDTFGNALIDDWLRSQGRSITDFSPVDRLCYMGKRGMGALEFRPVLRKVSAATEQMDVERLVELAARVLAKRRGLSVELDESGLNEILRVGTSAGGARAKAVIGWNRETNEVCSGQTTVPDGFEYWLLKFDGISESFDGVQDPQGYGRIEYAYSLMAKAAGITMSECRLFEEGGRAHFMTRRFDRPNGMKKVHCASLFGIAHLAYAAPGSHNHAYEDLFETISKLDLNPRSRIEAFRRMAFNVWGCNRDDHSKNVGFMMGEDGVWKLAPAFDVAYAYNPAPGKWTAYQQMSVRGKRSDISAADMIQAARNHDVATLPRLKSVLDDVRSALRGWISFAEQAGVKTDMARRIDDTIQRQLNTSP